jgi:hypothetical protein
MPCVIALPIVPGNLGYLAWIERETKAPDQPSSRAAFCLILAVAGA